jgi:ferredoxin--NADP+ reductase
MQAAFTNPEVRELGKMMDAHAVTLPHEVELDAETKAELETSKDQSTINKIEILKSFCDPAGHVKQRQLHIRFLVSPVEILGDENGRVRGVKLVKNELYRDDNGEIRSRSTEEYEELEAGIVFRSIGYHGVPLPEVPFHEKWGVIHNEKGRVTDPGTSEHLDGLYATGWIKRGPSGVIGTNKQDSGETVECIVEDIKSGKLIRPESPDRGSLEAFIKDCQPDHITYQDWLRLDVLEIERGKAAGRPRLKYTSLEEILEALKNQP